MLLHQPALVNRIAESYYIHSNLKRLPPYVILKSKAAKRLSAQGR